MTTIDPALHDRTASTFQVTASLSQSSRLRVYLLRAGEVTALVAFLNFCVMWVQWQASSHGFYNVSGDFVGFWTAGELALEGHAADAYREMPHFFKQLALHGDPSRLYLLSFICRFFCCCVPALPCSAFSPPCACGSQQRAPATPPQSAHCWQRPWVQARMSRFFFLVIRPSW